MPKGKAEPAAHAHHAEHGIGRQRIGKGDDQHIQVEHDAGVFRKQANEPDEDIINQVVVRIIFARDLIERPAQGAGQLAVAALHLTHPVDAVAAVEAWAPTNRAATAGKTSIRWPPPPPAAARRSEFPWPGFVLILAWGLL